MKKEKEERSATNPLLETEVAGLSLLMLSLVVELCGEILSASKREREERGRREGGGGRRTNRERPNRNDEEKDGDEAGGLHAGRRKSSGGV